jgi:hypothetical protein
VEILGPGRVEHRTSRKHNTEAGFQGSPTGSFIMSNVTMTNVRTPFWLDYQGESADGASASVHNHGKRAISAKIMISNLTATGLGRTPFVVLADADAPLESLVLNNVHMSSVGGVEAKQSNGQGMSPYSMLPWYGLYARSVENLEFHNTTLSLEDRDIRPAVFASNIGNLEFDHFHADRNEGAEPSLILGQVDRLVVDGKQASSGKFEIKGLDLTGDKIVAGEPF